MWVTDTLYIPWPIVIFIGALVVTAIVAGIRALSHREEEFNTGGQISTRDQSETEEETPAEEESEVVEEEDEGGPKDESEYISVKKGDKLPFANGWFLEVTGIVDEDDEIHGVLIVTLPVGAKYLDMDPMLVDDYPANVCGFSIQIDPAGATVAESITYDPDPSEPPVYEEEDYTYELRYDEVRVLESTGTAS